MSRDELIECLVGYGYSSEDLSNWSIKDLEDEYNNCLGRDNEYDIPDDYDEENGFTKDQIIKTLCEKYNYFPESLDGYTYKELEDELAMCEVEFG